ncbi:hypothetical protein MLD38_002816 [Melastoma candidum]|uniref:Uncharacterized protein n=1 Tax=Melastoma candidum TaxID=119954 RepID=A0ACB9S941_9MYRT|nr:hypothetical protein MLD38_002816 [Melastoma candidum]
MSIKVRMQMMEGKSACQQAQLSSLLIAAIPRDRTDIASVRQSHSLCEISAAECKKSVLVWTKDVRPLSIGRDMRLSIAFSASHMPSKMQNWDMRFLKAKGKQLQSSH